MDQETLDEFLGNATDRLTELWKNYEGEPLSDYEKGFLNDVLTAFFSSRIIEVKHEHS